MEDTKTGAKTEIIAIASGKGGTGKTLVASCLAYALIRGGQRVLVIDGDPATDGMSLFLLGRKGWTQISNFEPNNTFVGILSEFQRTRSLTYRTRTIHRSGLEDHGVPYQAIISGKGLYGDEESLTATLAVPDLDRSIFREGIRTLFQALRESKQYDYVLVDTRGGFAFESTDVCGLADSFIVVTEPDPTSFYQDRNLVRRINQAAHELNSPSVLRAFIVNKALDGVQQEGKLDLEKIEYSFRLELTKEFPVGYENTHPIPVDLDALIAYKTQRIPYVAEPGSLFSFATLSAFSDILQVVTSRWSSVQVEQWNKLVNEVSTAVAARNKRSQEQKEEAQRRVTDLTRLEAEAEGLRQRLQLVQEEKEVFERERNRMETGFTRELESLKAHYREQDVEKEKRAQVELEARRRMRQKSLTATIFVLSTLMVLGVFGWKKWQDYQRTNDLNGLLVQAYNQSLPPALRRQSMHRLMVVYDQCQFDSINLDRLDLSHQRLENCSFRGASLIFADLSDTYLGRAKLGSARLDGANLSGASLVYADLYGATLLGAQLSDSDFTGANLTKADLRGTDLSRSRVTQSQVDSAVLDGETRLPLGLRYNRLK